jgi:hypothetical protein
VLVFVVVDDDAVVGWFLILWKMKNKKTNDGMRNAIKFTEKKNEYHVEVYVSCVFSKESQLK